MKKYSKIKDKLNKETIINEKSIKELETTLSNLNSKTSNYERFKKYCIEKNKINYQLYGYYEKKIFRNLENDTHSNLIFLKHQIKFSDIQDFNISVSKLPFDFSFNYELDGLINHDHSAYTNKNENIYIEFSQNSNGYTICNSSFVGVDFFKICISPPN